MLLAGKKTVEAKILVTKYGLFSLLVQAGSVQENVTVSHGSLVVYAELQRNATLFSAHQHSKQRFSYTLAIMDWALSIPAD